MGRGLKPYLGGKESAFGRTYPPDCQRYFLAPPALTTPPHEVPVFVVRSRDETRFTIGNVTPIAVSPKPWLSVAVNSYCLASAPRQPTLGHIRGDTE